jgi:hypothetical protein
VNIIALIVSATNSYAENHDANRPREETPYSRTWKRTTLGEIYRYIGVWLYMGMHPETNRASYWSESHQLGRYLSRMIKFIVTFLHGMRTSTRDNRIKALLRSSDLYQLSYVSISFAIGLLGPM